jgi:hypothetical protein
MRRTCPGCLKRLPYAGRRCRLCGWTHSAGADPHSVRRAVQRRLALWSTLAVLFLVGTASFILRNAEGIADWYAGFAAEHLAQPFSSFAPRATDDGAFFYCARLVARQIEGDFAVQTFPAPREGSARLVGDRRYEIISFVENSPDGGDLERRDFSCTVRYERGRWVLEKLELEPPEAGGLPSLRSAARGEG